MSRRRRGSIAVLASLLLPVALLAPGAAATRHGSILQGPADDGVCAIASGLTRSSCTELQRPRSSSADQTRFGGVITRWTVLSGTATPATAAVRLRLRVLRGRRALPAASRYVALPLRQPGIHAFASRIPIGESQRVGLDVEVEGDGSGPAAAPLARANGGEGALGEWRPPLRPGAELPPTRRLLGDELLLAAKVERDRDRDGFGDGSQDECGFDPRTQGPCATDGTAPTIGLEAARRQPLRPSGEIAVRVQASEFAIVGVAGQLYVSPGAYGIYGSQTTVSAGDSALLSLWIPAEARRAARRYLALGRPVAVEGYVYATDASGNEARRAHVHVRLTPPGSAPASR